MAFHGLSQYWASAALHDHFMLSKPVPPGWLLSLTKSSHCTSYNYGYLCSSASVLSGNTSQKISPQWCCSLLFFFFSYLWQSLKYSIYFSFNICGIYISAFFNQIFSLFPLQMLSPFLVSPLKIAYSLPRPPAPQPTNSSLLAQAFPCTGA